MKYIIAFVCIAGIAIASAAPFAEEPVSAEIESEEDRAAQDEVVKAVPNPENNVAERAAEIPQVAPSEKAGDRSAAGGVQERNIVPSYKELVNALESKYLTADGQDLVKALNPLD